MKLPDAFRALIDGKKVKKTGWPNESYLKLDNGAWDTNMDVSFYEEDEWEIIEEPEKSST